MAGLGAKCVAGVKRGGFARRGKYIAAGLLKATYRFKSFMH